MWSWCFTHLFFQFSFCSFTKIHLCPQTTSLRSVCEPTLVPELFTFDECVRASPSLCVCVTNNRTWNNTVLCSFTHTHTQTKAETHGSVFSLWTIIVSQICCHGCFACESSIQQNMMKFGGEPGDCCRGVADANFLPHSPQCLINGAVSQYHGPAQQQSDFIHLWGFDTKCWF